MTMHVGTLATRSELVGKNQLRHSALVWAAAHGRIVVMSVAGCGQRWAECSGRRSNESTIMASTRAMAALVFASHSEAATPLAPSALPMSSLPTSMMHGVTGTTDMETFASGTATGANGLQQMYNIATSWRVVRPPRSREKKKRQAGGRGQTGIRACSLS